jgi:hypothetical protein
MPKKIDEELRARAVRLVNVDIRELFSEPAEQAHAPRA